MGARGCRRSAFRPSLSRQRLLLLACHSSAIVLLSFPSVLLVACKQPVNESLLFGRTDCLPSFVLSRRRSCLTPSRVMSRSHLFTKIPAKILQSLHTFCSLSGITSSFEVQHLETRQGECRVCARASTSPRQTKAAPARSGTVNQTATSKTVCTAGQQSLMTRPAPPDTKIARLSAVAAAQKCDF